MTRVTHDGTRWSNAADDPIEIAPYDPAWPARFARPGMTWREAYGRRNATAL